MANSENDSNNAIFDINLFKQMIHLYDRLLLLGIEKEFYITYKTKPIHRYYFSMATNPGEQFYAFSCLAAWLIKKGQLSSTYSFNPQAFEDPNVIINSILDSVRSTGEEITFSSNKLKQGFGIEVIFTLNSLAKVCCKNVTIPTTLNIQEDFLANDDEPVQLDVEALEDNEDLEFDFTDVTYALVDDQNEISFNQISNSKVTHKSSNQEALYLLPILKANVNANEWQLEVQAALPQLKSSELNLDTQLDWRSRLSDLRTRLTLIDEQLNTSRSLLGRLNEQIRRALVRLTSRERHLQQQMEPLVNEFSALQSELSKASSNYQKINGGVLAKSQRLQELADQIENIKEEGEKLGAKVSDVTPLTSMKKCITQLKNEIEAFDVRSGVAILNLIRYKTHQVNLANVAKGIPTNIEKSNHGQGKLGQLLF